MAGPLAKSALEAIPLPAPMKTRLSQGQGAARARVDPQPRHTRMCWQEVDVRVTSEPSTLRRASAWPPVPLRGLLTARAHKTRGAGRAEEAGLAAPTAQRLSACPPRLLQLLPAQTPPHWLVALSVFPSPRSPPISSARLGEPCPWAALAPRLEPCGLLPRPPPLQPPSPPPAAGARRRGPRGGGGGGGGEMELGAGGQGAVRKHGAGAASPPPLGEQERKREQEKLSGVVKSVHRRLRKKYREGKQPRGGPRGKRGLLAPALYHLCPPPRGPRSYPKELNVSPWQRRSPRPGPPSPRAPLGSSRPEERSAPPPPAAAPSGASHAHPHGGVEVSLERREGNHDRRSSASREADGGSREPQPRWTSLWGLLPGAAFLGLRSCGLGPGPSFPGCRASESAAA